MRRRTHDYCGDTRCGAVSRAKRLARAAALHVSPRLLFDTHAPHTRNQVPLEIARSYCGMCNTSFADLAAEMEDLGSELIATVADDGTAPEGEEGEDGENGAEAEEDVVGVAHAERAEDAESAEGTGGAEIGVGAEGCVEG